MKSNGAVSLEIEARDILEALVEGVKQLATQVELLVETQAELVEKVHNLSLVDQGYGEITFDQDLNEN